MRVLKFGGTSVATAPRRSVLADVVSRAAEQTEVVVVTSALAGVTENLLRLIEGKASVSETLDDFERRHFEELARTEGGIADVLSRRRLRHQLQRLSALLPWNGEEATRHRILASGERLALPLILTALRRRGLAPEAMDGSELILTRGLSRNPEIDLVATEERLEERLQSGTASRISVVTGFVGRDHQGRTSTLGRGASDLTATLMGSLLGANEVEIWSDVPGVLSGPPNLVSEPITVPRLSYGEAAALAHFGAKVLHPLALAPAAEARVPVSIHNTLDPQATGTFISDGTTSPGIKAISLVPETHHFQIRLPWTRQRSSRLLADLEDLGIRPLLVTSEVSGHTISFVVQASEAEAVSTLETQWRNDGCDVSSQDDFTALALVGAEASSAVEAGLQRILAQQGLEALGLVRPGCLDRPGRRAIVALVEDSQGLRALRSLHDHLVRAPRSHAIAA